MYVEVYTKDVYRQSFRGRQKEMSGTRVTVSQNKPKPQKAETHKRMRK